MIEWIFSIGIVLAAVALFIGLMVVASKMDIDFNEFMGFVCLIGFLVMCVIGLHDILYGGGK